MYQLDIITKIPEPEPDGIIRIRPGESAIVRIDESGAHSPTADICGRPAEWRNKTIPALVIALSDDLDEIFRVFHAPEDPEDAVPFIVISSDRELLLDCRAEGKILCRKTADCSSRPAEAIQYLHEIIGNTEYCIFLCSRRDPAWIQLAGQIALYAREQNTLSVLAVTGEKEPGSDEILSGIQVKFHSIIQSPDHSTERFLERIHDLCEATIDDIVASGGRNALVRDDRFVIRELLFNGGTGDPVWNTAGKPDAFELIRGYVKSIHKNNHTLIAGTYSILKIPWESTMGAATELRNSLLDILVEKVASKYPHQMRIEGYYPEIEGQIDLSIWTFSVKK
jgi:hypothetical protein